MEGGPRVPVRAVMRSVSPAAAVLWPIALFTMAHQIRDTYVSGPGGDLVPVLRAAHAFVHGRAPYDVDAFVYPPSALVLFAPLGVVGLRAGRLLFHLADAAAVVAAVWLLLRYARVRLGSPVAPAIVFAAFITTPVRSTLGLDNVNGLVLLAEVVTLVLLRRGRPVAAGVAFGLGLAVKPVLAPVLVLFLVDRRVRTVVASVAVPCVLSLVALAFTTDLGGFVRDVVPFLLRGNYDANYLINTSLRGAVRILELPSALSYPVRIAAAVAGAAVLVAHRRTNPPDDHRLVEAIGIVMATTFLVFSFSWAYYCIYLLPVFAVLADERSEVDRVRLAALGAAFYLVASPDYLARLGSVRVTAGLVVFVAAFAGRRRSPHPLS
jgi:arabinofuranan 3-O-arabinosyltransferase